MSQELLEPIIAHWRELREYAISLVADLDDQDMVSQPVPGVTMNHPAWVLSHLWAYAPVLTGILRNESIEDPLNHRYGRTSRPEPDLAEYLPRAELIESYIMGYDAAAEALVAAPSEHLASPTPITRWLDRFPTVAYLPAQFLLKHNALHLGQLSAWRRAGGRPPV